jgi:hypothetical protein
MSKNVEFCTAARLNLFLWHVYQLSAAAVRRRSLPIRSSRLALSRFAAGRRSAWRPSKWIPANPRASSAPVRRMFAVEQEPVEPGIAQNVGGDIAAKAAPQADLKLAGRDRVLEGIAGGFHVILNRMSAAFWRSHRKAWAAHPSGSYRPSSIVPQCG